MFSEPVQIIYVKEWEKIYNENKIPFVIFKSSDWWGSAIDGIPTEVSAYKIAEFNIKIINLQKIGSYDIWIANNFSVSTPRKRCIRKGI